MLTTSISTTAFPLVTPAQDTATATPALGVAPAVICTEFKAEAAPTATWRRILLGLLPAAPGEAPPVLYAMRSRALAWLWAAVGFVVGGAVGLLMVVLVWALPYALPLLLGFVVGAVFASAATLILVSRISFLRRGGALLLLLSPLLLLLAPFLLLGAGIFAARALPKPLPRTKAPPPAE